MKKIHVCVLCFSLITACNTKPSEEQQNDTTPTAATPQATEFADAKYVDIGKNSLAAMSGADLDAWGNIFSDNAKYFWNNGDSIVGKAAIAAYWKQRRTDVIDSITFFNDIWLAVKVNEPQQPMQTPGVWLLGWYQVRTKYKTGKTMSQWIHTDYHFDANDKVDEVVQYLDRAPINAATAK